MLCRLSSVCGRSSRFSTSAFSSMPKLVSLSRTKPANQSSNEMGDEFRSGLLIDTNLLVLLIVGSVNANRIATFKRTSKYSPSGFRELLLNEIRPFKVLYTVAHVMAEVSNLTDLTGNERSRAGRLAEAAAHHSQGTRNPKRPG